MRPDIEIPIDLKLLKLQGASWPRDNLGELGRLLYDKQGIYRLSFTSRIYVIFDGSTTSSYEFFNHNRELILTNLEKLVTDPIRWGCFENQRGIPFWIILFREKEYQQLDEFYEHNLGEGLREERKARFSTDISIELENRSKGKWRHNPNERQRGVDGFLTITG